MELDRHNAAKILGPNWENVTYLRIPEGVTKIGELFNITTPPLMDIVFPSTLEDIDRNAFYGCAYLSEVIFPEGLDYIGWWAFGFCSRISKIVIPDSVRMIAPSAFEYCTGLEEVIIPSHLIQYVPEAFVACWYKRIYFSDPVLSLDDTSFNNYIQIAEAVEVKPIDTLLHNDLK